MKVAFVLLALVALSSATTEEDGFSDIADAFKTTAGHLANVGKVAIDQLIEKAKEGLLNLTTSSLKKLLESLGGSSPTKRDLAQIGQVIEKVKSSIAFVKNLFGNAKDEGKSIVDQMMVDAFALIEKVNRGEVTDDLIKEIRELVDKARTRADALGSKLLTTILSGLTSASTDSVESKRFLKDTFQSVLDVITPMIDNLKEVISSIGVELKNKLITVQEAVKISAADLQGKLLGHLDALTKQFGDLKGQGAGAVQALKDAVSDILVETLKNAGDTINQEVMQTINNAANTVTDHVIDAIKKKDM